MGTNAIQSIGMAADTAAEVEAAIAIESVRGGVCQRTICPATLHLRETHTTSSSLLQGPDAIRADAALASNLAPLFAAQMMIGTRRQTALQSTAVNTAHARRLRTAHDLCLATSTTLISGTRRATNPHRPNAKPKTTSHLKSLQVAVAPLPMKIHLTLHLVNQALAHPLHLLLTHCSHLTLHASHHSYSLTALAENRLSQVHRHLQ